MIDLEQSLAAKMVWSFVARVDEVDLDDDPQKVIARTLYNLAAGKYSDGLVGVAAECRVPWPVDDAVLDAAAWAGQARWALIQRDRAIRSAVAQGASERLVAAAVGRPWSEGHERRLNANTHTDRCRGINCPCYNEGWRDRK